MDFSERGLALNSYTPSDPIRGSYDVPNSKEYNLRTEPIKF